MPNIWRKPVKRAYVTREEALLCLAMDPETFDRMCVLNNVHPCLTKRSEQTNRSTRIQYKLEDIHRIRRSGPHEKVATKKRNREKRAKYIAMGREDRIKNLRSEDIDYKQLILQKYPSLDEAIDDLGECLSCLFLCERLLQHARRLHIEFNVPIRQKIQRELETFLLFVCLRGAEMKTFLSQSGAYYETEARGKKVFWKAPFHVADEEELLGINYDVVISSMELYVHVLEKVNYKLLKEAGLEWYAKERKGSAVSGGGSEAGIDLLSVLKQFQSSPEAKEASKPGAFGGQAFYLADDCSAIRESLVFLILFGGGSTVSSPEAADIYVTGGEIEEAFDTRREYVHPQFVYDSTNLGGLLDRSLYKIGKTLPTHASPFAQGAEESSLAAFNLSKRRRLEVERLQAYSA